MNRNSIILSFFVASCFAFIACGDDSTTGDTKNDTTTSSSSSSGGESSSSSSSGGGASGSSSSSSSSGAGGGGGAGGSMASGACVNKPDGMILGDPNSMIKQKVQNCALKNFGNDAKTLTCIETDTMLSHDCSVCFADTVKCATDKCSGSCFPNPDTQACTDCRAAMCDPAFEACSGIKAGGP